MTNIAVFASGSGTNAESIINHFKLNKIVKVGVVLCNNPNAYVIHRAKKLKVPVVVFNREEFKNENFLLGLLNNYDINWLVLAGFLWLMPKYLTDAYKNRIINIHPALLPKYGGKGMYGLNVHKAVVENNEKESGITIHFVNEKYDDGKIIFQAKCPVLNTDTPETLAEKVHDLEYQHFPGQIEKTILRGC